MLSSYYVIRVKFLLNQLTGDLDDRLIFERVQRVNFVSCYLHHKANWMVSRVFRQRDYDVQVRVCAIKISKN